MREIKFRAWDKTNKKWLRPKFNGVICYGGDNHICIIDNKPTSWGGYEAQEPRFLTWKEAGELEIVQFTGLKDKNGKEIYEGDILKSHGQVIWNEEEYRWSCIDLNWNDKKEVHDIDYLTSPFEIIGNIFENPELINHPLT